MDTSYKTIVLLTLLLTHAVTSTAAKLQAQTSSSKLAPKNAEQVDVNVTVNDKTGGFVVGLKPSDFEVSIDKKLARIVSVSQADLPVSVGILLDSSGSVGRGSDKQTARNFYILREAVRHFLESSNQANDYFLMGFNIKPQLMADWTSDPLTIIDKFDHLRVNGNTALYDACYLAVDKLHEGSHPKHALVLISDGQDNFSDYSFNQLRDLLRETNVLLYSIYFPSSTDLGSGLGMEGSAILKELSFLSGGKLFSNKDGAALRLRDANAVFQIIATELRNQYTLSIIPAEPMASKKWHKIKVKVNLPAGAPREMKGLSVRYREGFYAH